MLVLYDSKTTLFDTLGLGVLKDIKSDPIITEELNGAYTLEFEYAVKGYLGDKLIEGNIVKANSQAFRIWNITKNINTIRILAKHIFFDLSKNFIEDVAPTNLSSQGALEWILKRTQYNNNFTVSGSCSELASARYVEKNVIDAIFNEDNAILKRFGGELQLDNYNIYIHSKRGNNTSFSIRYGKNLSAIDFNLDFSTVVTRICPQGKDDLHLDKKYVDSPLINNYFMPFYKKMEFDIGIDDNTTEEQAKQNLLKAAKQEFNNGIDVPNISVKVDFIELSKCMEYSKYSNLEKCHLGDSVQAIIPTLNLNITTRVVKTVYNCALKRLTSLELGNTVPNFVTESNKKDEAANNAIRKINTTDILNQAKKDATSIINHPFNGNLYIDENSGTLYLLDTTDPATAKCVWKWSLGGLGFSSTGINGIFETAMTQDGKIVADFITTGTMAVERIKGLSTSLKLIVEDIQNIESNQTITATTEESKVFHLTDSADSNCKSVEIFGESTQNGTSTATAPVEIESISGKNKLYMLDGTLTSNGLTTITTNGTMNIKGVATSSWANLTSTKTLEKPLPAGDYIFSVDKAITGILYIALYDNAGGNYPFYIASGETTKQISIPVECVKYYMYIGAGLTNGTTYDYEIKPMISKTSSFYVPYNHIGFKSIGKNYLNVPSTYELTGSKENVSIDIPAGEYIISFASRETTGSYTSLIILYMEDGTSKSIYLSNEPVAFSIDKKVIKYNIYSQNSWATSQNIKTTFKDLMIRKSTDNDVYEPYKEIITTISLLHDMRSLPNGTKDRIYYSNGKWYDEQRVGCILSNGSENWGTYANGTHINGMVFALRVEGLFSSYAPEILSCNRFATVRDGYYVDIESISSAGNGYIYVNILKSRLNTENVAGFKTWLASNNIEVIYELAKPIVTEITDEATIAALESVKTFKGITNIEADAPSVLTYYRNVPMVDEYETKQNANKQYSKTIEKFAEQEITNDGIRSEVSRIESTITNDYMTKEEASTQYSQLSDSFNYEVNKAVADLRENGVPKVVSTLVTIDKNGLTTGRSDSDFTNTMNNTGNYQYHAGELIAKYDKDGADIPKLKSDVAIIAGLKYTKEDVVGVVHHKTYVLE